MIIFLSLLAFLCVAGAVVGAWDISRRKLEIETSKLSLTHYESAVLAAFQEYVERNDKITTNFLTQMKEVVRYTETERQAAKGGQLNQSLNGRWKNK